MMEASREYKPTSYPFLLELSTIHRLKINSFGVPYVYHTNFDFAKTDIRRWRGHDKVEIITCLHRSIISLSYPVNRVSSGGRTVYKKLVWECLKKKDFRIRDKWQDIKYEMACVTHPPGSGSHGNLTWHNLCPCWRMRYRTSSAMYIFFYLLLFLWKKNGIIQNCNFRDIR